MYKKALGMRGWLGLFALVLLLLSGGCIPQETKRIGATDTVSNISAIEEAGRSNDRKAIPALISQLESDDAAVRFYAIKSLQKLTNQTLGYRYFDDADERRVAVERWKSWLAVQPMTTPK